MRTWMFLFAVMMLAACKKQEGNAAANGANATKAAPTKGAPSKAPPEAPAGGHADPPAADHHDERVAPAAANEPADGPMQCTPQNQPIMIAHSRRGEGPLLALQSVNHAVLVWVDGGQGNVVIVDRAGAIVSGPHVLDEGDVSSSLLLGAWRFGPGFVVGYVRKHSVPDCEINIRTVSAEHGLGERIALAADTCALYGLQRIAVRNDVLVSMYSYGYAAVGIGATSYSATAGLQRHEIVPRGPRTREALVRALAPTTSGFSAVWSATLPLSEDADSDVAIKRVVFDEAGAVVEPHEGSDRVRWVGTHDLYAFPRSSAIYELFINTHGGVQYRDIVGNAGSSRVIDMGITPDKVSLVEENDRVWIRAAGTAGPARMIRLDDNGDAVGHIYQAPPAPGTPRPPNSRATAAMSFRGTRGSLIWWDAAEANLMWQSLTCAPSNVVLQRRRH